MNEVGDESELIEIFGNQTRVRFGCNLVQYTNENVRIGTGLEG